MQRLICLQLLLLSLLMTQAATTAGRVKYKHGPAYIYRITLCDKKGTPFTLDHPFRYLSRRSIERRRRQHLPIDSTDLPISPRYLRQLEALRVNIVGKSRWQNTVLIRTCDTAVVSKIKVLPFVLSSRLVWTAPDSVEQTATRAKCHDAFETYDSVTGQVYGKTWQQISSVGGHRLHERGFQGEGMMIAIIDGGFKNADRIPAFQHVNMLGYHDFIAPPASCIFSETDHGTKVLSAMAVNKPFYYIGAATKASYWLLRSEDQQTEQEVEEDYWTMAAEFADSVGCNLINSSLGYNEFDQEKSSYRQWQLDGKTAFVSRSASLLSRKGIILVNSAGNSGMGPWKKIGVPADADDILTVGAVTPDEPRHIAPFSSIGPSQDGRIKPDVVAIGAPAWLVNGRGVILEDMGTSFSAPVVCGLAACLWQALPHLTAHEIMQLIRESGDNCQHPDNIYGYGMPNFWRAYMVGKMKTKNE